MTESSMHNNISVVCRTTPQVCHGYISTCSLHVEFDNRHQLSFILDERTGLKGKRVVVLDIPDEYDYMQPELVALLEVALLRRVCL